MPAQAVIEKGNKGADKTGKRWIQGIASTNERDLQGETVNQPGIDFSYFKQYGYFNDDHKQGNKHRVGEPTECRVSKNGLYVKGFLLNGKEAADDIWKHMQSLEASGSSRKMGFSIEGKIRRRNGRHIEKCWVQNVAITAAPVNTSTWAEIAKSLTAGSATIEDSEKALEAGTGDNPLVPESLEGSNKEDRESTNKSLSFSETVQFIQSEHPGMSEEGAKDVATVIFATYS